MLYILLLLFAAGSYPSLALESEDKVISEEEVIPDDDPISDPILLSHLSSRDLLACPGIPFSESQIKTKGCGRNINADSPIAAYNRPIKKLFMQKLGPCFLTMVTTESPNGQMVATAIKNTTMVWSVSEKRIQRLYILEGHRKKVINIVFSPNGKHVVTTSNDRTVKIWSLKNGELLYTLPNHSSPVVLASYNDDCTELAVNTDRGSAYIWFVPIGD